MKHSIPRTILHKAVNLLGGQTATAEAIERETKKPMRQSTVRGWLYDTKQGVPSEYCPILEKLTGIPRHKFRPDVYGDA